MNWFNNLCSCITPHFRYSVIGYLNSNQLNNQVIQQQKCTQQQRQPQPDPTDNVYTLAKSKSYNFMTYQNKDKDKIHGIQKINRKDNSSQSQSNSQQQQNNNDVINVFWYPKSNKTKPKYQKYQQILAHKLKIFGIILQTQPSSNNYDKIYDSQDQTNLLVYCRLQSLIKGKKMNSYRFSFNIQGVKLQNYQEWLKNMEEKNIMSLLEQSKIIDTDPNDKNFSFYHRFFNKLLVVNPHDLLTAQKTIKNQDQQKSFVTVIFSIKPENQQKKQKNKQENKYSRGWLHLAGIQVIQSQNGLKVHGCLTLQLNVSVSPNMLKQPIAKQIRIFVQKFICNLKKSDQI